jgi:predicted membrane-bound mannosyltransferase
MQTGSGLRMRRSLPVHVCSFMALLLRLVALAAIPVEPLKIRAGYFSFYLRK